MAEASRLAAALSGRYAVERELGHGGMATVYLAQDLKHHRRVAIKVLRGEIAASLGAERFTREIEVAARLQHPHILPLLDSGEADGFYYYVMPYIDGESLRDRLARHGEMPVHEAVRVLVEVTDALAHAHAHGVVHRDIKPDNILVSGRHALVTDFGVAKAVSEATGRQALTSIGVALGTPAYMAPEQAAADPHLDHRVDLYSVGILGYELLTGAPPFQGRTAQETLAAHMTQPPEPLSRRRPGISPGIEQVLMKCLAKRPADRWQTAEELLTQLEPLATPSGGTTPTTTRPVPAVAPRRRWVSGAIAAGVIGIAVVGLLLRTTAETITLGTVTQLTREPGLEIEPAISPDGRFVAYAAGPISATRLYIRQVGGRAVALLPDSGAAQRRPLWSPDGARILFERARDLYVVPALGGVPRLVMAQACCAAWSPDGQQIAYVRPTAHGWISQADDSVYVSAVVGGMPRLLGVIYDPYSLAWSPTGRWIAMSSGNSGFATGKAGIGNKGPSQILLIPASGGAPVQVTGKSALNESPAWTPDGRHLLFMSNRDGARDIYSQRLSGSGSPSGRALRLTTGLNAHSLSLSADGKQVAYSVFISRSNVWAIPIPTAGAASIARAVPVTTGNETVETFAVSPDRRWLYFDTDRGGNADIYRVPVTGGEAEQLTTDSADDFGPNVSPDGRWIAFHSLRYGTRDILVMAADGGVAERVTDAPSQEYQPKWSPDGQSLAYEVTGGAGTGVWVVSRTATGAWGTPRRVWDKDGRNAWANDGQSLLGVADSGIWRIPLAGEPAQLLYQASGNSKADVPIHAIWATDGRKIYFEGLDREGRASIWSLADRTPRLLVRFDDPGKPFLNSRLATDGRRFYVALGDRQSDIFVAALQGLR